MVEPFLDYEKLAEVYDGMLLTEKGETTTRYSPISLYGWDCESIVLFNLDCIK